MEHLKQCCLLLNLGLKSIGLSLVCQLILSGVEGQLMVILKLSISTVV
ncbi:hypothetical protein CF161_25943 [Pseudomonas sp. CF161]|nr:hypothetical protein CF161_25943 [Pseudomonas sp. CF161]